MDRTGNARLENDAEENHPRYQLGYWPAQLDITRTYMLAKKDRRIHILEQVCIIIENYLITVQATVHLTGEIKFIYQGKISITNGRKNKKMGRFI